MLMSLWVEDFGKITILLHLTWIRSVNESNSRIVFLLFSCCNNSTLAISCLNAHSKHLSFPPDGRYMQSPMYVPVCFGRKLVEGCGLHSGHIFIVLWTCCLNFQSTSEHDPAVTEPHPDSLSMSGRLPKAHSCIQGWTWSLQAFRNIRMSLWFFVFVWVRFLDHFICFTDVSKDSEKLHSVRKC